MPKKKRKGDVRQTLVEMPGGRKWELCSVDEPDKEVGSLVASIHWQEPADSFARGQGWRSFPSDTGKRVSNKFYGTPQAAAKRFGKFTTLSLADQEQAKEAEQARVEHDNAPCATCGHDRVHHMTGGLDCTRDDCRCSGYVQPQEQAKPKEPYTPQDMVKPCAGCGHTRYAHTTPDDTRAPCACRVCDCKCEAFVPAQEPEQAPAACQCGHHVADHGPDGCVVPDCTCTESHGQKPDQYQLCTCGHARYWHGGGTSNSCGGHDCPCEAFVLAPEQPEYEPDAFMLSQTTPCVTCGHQKAAHTRESDKCCHDGCECRAFVAPTGQPCAASWHCKAHKPAQPEPASQAATEKPTVDTSSAMAGALLVKVLMAGDAATAAADYARFALSAATALAVTNRPLAYKLFGGADAYLSAKAELSGIVFSQDRHARTLLCLSNDIHRPFPDPIE